MTANSSIATADEISSIKILNEKRAALENLIFIMDENSPLMNEKVYHRFLEDYQLIIQQTHEFWRNLALAHNMPLDDSVSYILDYESGVISLTSIDKD